MANACCCVLPPAPFLSVNQLLFCGGLRKPFPFILFGVVERGVGKESRQFLVDILTLVAVVLGQEFGIKRGLEGFGFLVLFWWTWWVFGPVGVVVFCVWPHWCGFFLCECCCRISPRCMPPPLMGSEAPLWITRRKYWLGKYLSVGASEKGVPLIVTYGRRCAQGVSNDWQGRCGKYWWRGANIKYPA